MKKNYLSNFTSKLPCEISKILNKINKNEQGIIFIVDKNFTLKGSISDGDIRRYLLKGGKLNSVLKNSSSLINKNPKAQKIDSKIEDILKILNSYKTKQKIKCLPLVDQKNQILDISTIEKIRRFPLATPSLGYQELSNVTDAIKTGWVSSRGPYIRRFEEDFQSYLGGGYAVAVTNGTCALQIGLMSLGIKKGDEVIVPSFTFGGSINAIINAGATPVIADVDIKNWTLDLKNIKKKITKKTKAIMPVHIYGQPYEIDQVKKFAKEKKLMIVDDCAEAVGAIYKKKVVGLENDCSCFSFFANKTITTGEGGMAVFKRKEIAEKARILINQGLSNNKRYYHDFAGTNSRITNLQAAMGVAQMKIIKKLLANRKKIFSNYDKIFKTKKFLTLLNKNEWSENSYWLYTLLINDITEKKRDLLITKIQNLGIECRPGFYALHKMKPFKRYADGEYPNTEYLSKTSISLPTTHINIENQNFIAQTFLKELENLI